MIEESNPSQHTIEESQWSWNARYEPLSALARFVSEPALEGTRLRLRDAPILRRGGADSAAGDLIVARAAYERLLALGLSAAWEPWAPRWSVQRIRHPDQIVFDEHADCLDLALLYAGICQAAHVAPLLAVVENHALVLLTPGRLHERPRGDEAERYPDAWPPFQLEGAVEQEPGVYRVQELAPLMARVATGEVVPVNAYNVVHGARFEQAVAAGEEALQRPLLHVIDIPWLHSRPETEPVRAPARVIDMSPYLPGGDDEFIEYPSRAALGERLAASTGIVVLLGESGSGKSMLARHLVATARYGAGWLLNASSPESLSNSLARAHLARREREPGGSDERDRGEHADAALSKLRLASHPWVVVLDNADGDPGPLARWTPAARAQHRQLVIVTSIREAWREHPGVDVIELPLLPEEDVANLLADERLAELAAGRPLLIDSFAKLTTRAEVGSLRSAVDEVAALELEPTLRGPAVVWSAIRAKPEIDAGALGLVGRIALLPADHQPLQTLESLEPAARTIVESLARDGLLTLDGEAVRMHRLFGTVVRAERARSAPAAQPPQALSLLRNPESAELLERYGDLPTSTRLAAMLLASDDMDGVPRAELGAALHALGRTLELQGDSLGSAEVYEHAQPLLDDPLQLADCLQGRARAVNQHEAGDEKRVDQAIAWTREAQDLIELAGRAEQAGRTVAMRGLLLQKLAAFPAREGEREKLLSEARGLIDDAHQRRLATLDADDPELLRSRFNFGGIEVNLAQAHPDRAAEHLQRAEDTYREVARRRREIYGVEIHPHIAACHSGLVLVGYYRATLLPASAVQRSAWLRDATENALEAIHQREVLDGPADSNEIRKIAARLTKTAAARAVAPGHERAQAEPLFAQIVSELPARET